MTSCIELQIDLLTNEEWSYDFDIDIKFTSRDKWEYDYDLRDQEFSVEYDHQDNLNGHAAPEEMERILSEVTIDIDQSIGELKAAFLVEESFIE